MNLKELLEKMDMDAAHTAHRQIGEIFESMNYSAPELLPFHLDKLAKTMNDLAVATCLVTPSTGTLANQSTTEG